MKLITSTCPDYVVDEYNRGVMAALFNWCIRNPEGVLNPVKGIWLYGASGTGKTTLAKAVVSWMNLNWVCRDESQYESKYITAEEYAEQYIRDGVQGANWVHTGIDDVGSEAVPAFYKGSPLNVINYAIRRLEDTRANVPRVITTSLTMTEVYKRYGARTCDALGRMFNFIRLEGPSRRNPDGKPNPFWEIYKAEQTAAADVNASENR